ncbi:MAG: hypothetical protein MR717_07660 [Prevotella sp.]|nr:hypothetical protein [Prevotella sp.]
MKRKYIVTLALLLAFTVAGTSEMSAQAKRKKVQKQQVVSEEELQRMAKIEEMVYATQKIVIIDSVIVSKNQLAESVSLPSEAGSFVSADKVLGSGVGEGTACVNEMGDKAYFVKKDARGMESIYTSDRLDGQWSAPQPVQGLASLGDSASFNCPFMLADGTTLYFSALSKEGIGGYDIYVTRFDADENKFFKPENVGMPFNSTANDYFYIVDEFDNIGWFATDRNQPEGKVCIYTFVPSELRETYDPDIDYQQLRGYADISSIANTWGNGVERKKALERIKEAQLRQQSAKRSNGNDFVFVVNDDTEYHTLAQFCAEGNVERFVKLFDMKTRLEKLSAQLEKARLYYGRATKEDRDALRDDMLSNELTVEKLQIQIKELEKEIRNAENKEILR